MVRIIRKKPRLSVAQDARDNYIGESGKVIGQDLDNALVLIQFADYCRIWFTLAEVENE